MQDMTITCNAQFWALHVTYNTLKTCNTLQCITITLALLQASLVYIDLIYPRLSRKLYVYTKIIA